MLRVLDSRRGRTASSKGSYTRRFPPSPKTDSMFRTIAVIGSGTMGAGIAGQIANAGHEVRLLDLPSEGGGSPNAVAEAAVARLLASEPPALMSPDAAERIRTGNTRDDLEALAEADWVIEAIVERLDVKRALYARLADIVPAHCVVSSNTSTIPIRLLVEGMPEAFRRRFAITHYFNPVRYMRLLELVRGESTEAAVIEGLAAFNDRELGKGVVHCEDTPGFLGNRVGVFALQVGIDEAIRNELPIETADALMGRPMGIPKTGVFGLYDLIGIDLMADVVRSLRAILPEGDAFHAVGAESPMIERMIAEGLTGAKGGGGFYRRDAAGRRVARRLGSGDYAPLENALPERAAAAARAIAERREPLSGLIEGEDAEARFCRNVLGRVLGYAASLLGDVTDSPQAVDDAMKLGFNWVRGPFEMIDALGGECVARLLVESDPGGAAAVPATLSDARPFYTVADADASASARGERSLHVRLAGGTLEPIRLPDGVVRFHLARRALTPLLENESASLFAIEGDLRLVEFHSKANALTEDSMAVVAAAAADHGAGILIHNDAQHYSAGVDLNAFLALIEAEDFDGIDAFLERFQDAVAALKYCPVPVVGAPSGLALGGGFEVLMHCDALVVHANSVLGLVEAGVGLLPAGGGVKETFLRWSEAEGPAAGAWRSWMNLGYGATGSSPALAERLRYFRPGTDASVMNRDRLYSAGVARLRELAAGYSPPSRPSVTLPGGDIRARMRAFMDAGVERGDFSAHNRTVALAIGGVITSDSGEAETLEERALYARERAAFVDLARAAPTREAIASLLGASPARARPT